MRIYMHAKKLWLFLCLTGLAADAAADQKFKADFFRGVKPGQSFRCEAKADYLSEYYFSGSIKSAKVTLKSRQVEVRGIMTVAETAAAQPSVLEIKVEKISGAEDGAIYPPDIAGKTVMVKRDGNGKTVFTLKDTGKAVTAQDAALLSMIFDLGKPEPAGKTIFGYPGEIEPGKAWTPDLELFRSQLPGLNVRPEKLDGSIALNKKQTFSGIDCWFLSMNINCEITGGEKVDAVWHVAFPVDNAVYGPVKKHLNILRRRQSKLPESNPLAAGQIIHSEERFRIETVLLPVQTVK